MFLYLFKDTFITDFLRDTLVQSGLADRYNMKHILLILLLVPQIVNADVLVHSDFHFPISPSDYKKVLENYNPLSDLSQAHINEIKISAPYKTSLQNIDMVFEGDSHIVPKDGVGGFSFNIDINKARLSINKIITNDAIVKTVGGAIINVLINGSCSNVVLDTSSSSLKVAGDLSVVSQNGRLQLQVNNFAVQGSSAWGVKTGSCVAFPGYQQLLEEAIISHLQNSATVRNMLNDSLANLTSKMAAKLNGQILTVMNSEIASGVKLVLTPQSVDLDAQSGWLVIQGEVVAKMASEKSGDVVVAAGLDQNADALMNTSGLLISQEFIQAVIKNMHETKHLKYSFLAQQIEGFKSLLNNRFFQFFLWSDLRNFATNAAFQFEAFAKGAPQVSLVASDKGNLWYNIKDLVGVNMNAPKNDSLIPYMNFESDMDVNSWLLVSKGRMFLGFQKPKMTLAAAWDENYVATYKPSKSINTGFFKGQIADAVKKYQHNILLPQLKMNSLNFKAKSFNANQKWVQLVYGLEN